MSNPLVAVYARVSTAQPAERQAIHSQVAAVRAHLAERGVTVPPQREFPDVGYSGTTLARPALERLRDLAASGGLDELYVPSPDRLARRYAYQVLLLEEFTRAGVRVVFVTRPHGQSPEDDLLLQVQGMVAEYERARFLERSRRGKRHAARSGVIGVLTGAPYGHRYVPKRVWELVGCCRVGASCRPAPCASTPPASATAAIGVAGRSTHAARADARSRRPPRLLSVAIAGRPTSS
jgi:site-specific DNA recombinase